MTEHTTPIHDADEIRTLSMNLAILALQLADKADEVSVEEHLVSVLMLVMANTMMDIAKRLLSEADTPKASDVELGKQLIKAVSKFINPELMEKINEQQS